MTETTEQKDNKSNKPKGFWKKFFRFVKKTVFYGLISFVILSLALIILSQFYFFRSYVTDIALSYVNGSLEGKLEADDLKINPFRGIELTEARLLAAGDTIAYIPKVTVDIDFWELTSGKIDISSIYLDKPVIKLLRSRSDSTFNVDHIAPPSDDTTTSGPSTLVLDVKGLVLNDATYIMVDSLYQENIPGKLDFSNLYLEHLNVALDARVELESMDFIAEVKKLDFKERNSGFAVDNIRFDTDFDSTHINVKNLALNTDNSKINLRAEAHEFNIFGDIDEETILKSFFIIDLNAREISPRDFAAFVDEDIQLPDEISLVVKASGSHTKFDIEELSAKVYESEIELKAEAYKIFDFMESEVTINIAKAYFRYNDIPAFVREGVPDFNYLSINNTLINKNRQHISSDIDISSGLGHIEAVARFDISETAYEAKITTSDLKIGRILRDNSISGRINSNIDVKGKSFDLSSMTNKLTLRISNSDIAGYALDELYLSSGMQNSLLTIDTLYLRPTHQQKDYTVPIEFITRPKLLMSGSLNLKDIRNISYELLAEFQGINLMSLLGSTSMPEQFGGSFEAKGNGFDPDDMVLDFNTDIYECTFGDRALLPFKANIILEKDDSLRSLKLNSDFVDIILSGDFKFSNLASLLDYQAGYLENYIDRKISAFMSGNSDSLAYQTTTGKIDGFAPLNLFVNAQLHDISMLSSFIDDAQLFCKASLALEINADKYSSKINLDSLNIHTFKFKTKDSELEIQPSQLKSSISLGVSDSNIVLNNLVFSLQSNYKILSDGLSINRPFVSVNSNGDAFDLDISVNIDDMINLSTRGEINLGKTIGIALENTAIEYQNLFGWKSYKPLIASLGADEIDLKQFAFKRDSAETIEASGRIAMDTIDNVKILISRLPFNSINPLLDAESREALNSVSGSIEQLSLGVNGKLTDPIINLNFSTDNITIEKYNIGRIKAQLNQKNELLKGNIKFAGLIKNEPHDFLNLDIRSFPLDLSLNNKGNVIHNRKEFDISLNCNSMPLKPASPFLADFISNLNGSLNAKLDIFGKADKKITYTGSINIPKLSFLSKINNMSYTATADINIIKNDINIRKIEIKNIDRDRNLLFRKIPGSAKIAGVINLEDFNVKKASVNLYSNGFKIMSSASSKPMPTLYGDFIIATGNKPISFKYTGANTSIKGDLKIVNAELNMPNLTTANTIDSYVKYEVIDDSLTKEYLDSLKEIAEKNRLDTSRKTKQKEIESSIEIDVSVNLESPISMDMELGQFQNLLADIGISGNKSIRIYKEKNNNDLKLFGTLEILDGSKLKFYKIFDTYGTISFPTGNPTDPYLNITALYKGSSIVNSLNRTYKVIMKIKGTKDAPNIDFEYYIDDEKKTGDKELIKENAIFLIVTGKTKEELGKTGASADIMEGLQGELVGTAISAIISDAFSRTAIIESAELEYSDSWEDSKLHLRGQFVGSIDWQVGGTVADLSNNFQITLEAPLENLTDVEWVKQLLSDVVASFSKTTNNQTTISNTQKDWEIKIKYQKTF